MNSFIRFVFFFIVCFVLIKVIDHVASSAHAMTVKGNPEICTFWGAQMRNIAGLRDMGASWSEIEPEFARTIKEALGQKGSILQDADDAAYVTEDAKAVWGELKDKSPSDVYVWAVSKCMASKPKQL